MQNAALALYNVYEVQINQSKVVFFTNYVSKFAPNCESVSVMKSELLLYRISKHHTYQSVRTSKVWLESP